MHEEATQYSAKAPPVDSGGENPSHWPLNYFLHQPKSTALTRSTLGSLNQLLIVDSAESVPFDKLHGSHLGHN